MFPSTRRIQAERALAHFALTPTTLPLAIIGVGLCGAAGWGVLALF